MRRVSQISTPEEFSVEVCRELLREWRLRRRLAVFLAVVSAAIAAEVLPRLPGFAAVFSAWF